MIKCVNDDCDYFKTYGECSSACENQGFTKKITNFDRISGMSIDEMAEYFASNKHPNFPSSPCYVCEYDEGFYCTNKKGCTDEYRIKVYKDWLESEV